MYYQCKFTSPMSAYATDVYDLKTNDEKEIEEILHERGFEVSEIYDIKKQ